MEQITEYIEKAEPFGMSVILVDDTLFLRSEYRIVRDHARDLFVPCEKAAVNGQLQLLYFWEKLTPLSELAGTLNEAECFRILTELGEHFVQMQENGFLTSGRILLDMERIFADPASMRIFLVYLPIRSLTDNPFQKEKAIRTSLLRIASSMNGIGGEYLKELCGIFADPALTLSEMRSRMASVRRLPLELLEVSDGNRVSETAGSRRIIVSGEYTLIGKSSGANVRIRNDPAVSRRHCCLTWRNGSYEIEDLGSTNGTWLNGVLLRKGMRQAVKEGDRIGIADLTFEVSRAERLTDG